jgi:hypothetical protein
VKVINEPGFDIGRAAVRCALSKRYVPAWCGGRRVSDRVKIRVNLARVISEP